VSRGVRFFMDEDIEAVYTIVRQIPPGKVLAYGQVGAEVGVRPRRVGRIMAFACEEDAVPWHRVVGSDGTLRLASRSPAQAQVQRRLLEAEGVVFDSRGRVSPQFFLD